MNVKEFRDIRVSLVIHDTIGDRSDHKAVRQGKGVISSNGDRLHEQTKSPRMLAGDVYDIYDVYEVACDWCAFIVCR